MTLIDVTQKEVKMVLDDMEMTQGLIRGMFEACLLWKVKANIESYDFRGQPQ